MLDPRPGLRAAQVSLCAVFCLLVAAPIAQGAAAPVESPPAAPRIAGPRELPEPIARLPGVERLALALQRYGDVDTPITRDDVKVGLLSDKCKVPDQQDAEWDRGSTKFHGEHQNCYPHGLGRTQSQAYARKGNEWVLVDGPWVIGELKAQKVNDCGIGGCSVRRVRSSAEPAGLVEVRWPNGLRQFLEIELGDATVEPGDSKVIRVLGSARADGTVVVNDQKGRWSGRFTTAQREFAGTLYRMDGSSATATFKNFVPTGLVTWRSPDGTVEIAGDVYGASERPSFDGWIDVTLRAPLGAVPPGKYLIVASELPWDAAWPAVARRARELIPADAATLRASTAPPADCRKRPDLVPPGWVVWWPACSVMDAKTAARMDIPPGMQAMTLWSPDLRQRMTYSLQADGTVANREVMEFKGITAQDRSAGLVRRWSAPNWKVVGGRLAVDGEGDFYAYNDDHIESAHYHGVFNGLTPNGRGLCDKPADEGGGVEPCTYTAGNRTDQLYHMRLQRYAMLAAMQQERERQEQADRARQQREADLQAQQEEEAQAAAQRQRELEQEEEDAAAQSAAFNALNSLNESVKQQSAASMQATQQQAQGYLNLANQLAQQKAQQQTQQYPQQQALQYPQTQAPQQSSSGYAGSTAANRPTPTPLAPLNTAKAQRCSALYMQFSGASLKVSECVGDQYSYPTIGAFRDAERSCQAKIDAQTKPARDAYAAECGSNGPSAASGQ